MSSNVRFAALFAVSLAACTAAAVPDAAVPVDGAPDVAIEDAPVDVPSADAVDASDAAIADVSVDAGPLWTLCEQEEGDAGTVLAAVASTLVATVAPGTARVASPDLAKNPASHDALIDYVSRGYDRYGPGAAQTRVQRTELGTAPSTTTTRHSLAWFVHLSDTQLVDDESPNRLALADSPGTAGALRPQEMFLPRALSAMNRTLASLAVHRPFAFGVIAGDCADSAQHNELGWFLDVMGGSPTAQTDSGERNDLITGPGNDPKDAFVATPFPAPWYFVPGNHDVEIVGVSAPTETYRTSAIGTRSTTGTRDYRLPFGRVRSGTVVADPARQLLTRDDIVSRVGADGRGSGPMGHGIGSITDTTDGAHYTVDAIPGLLRLIAIDTSDFTGGSPGIIRRSTVDHFLRPQLERAEADGVLAMLVSHHRTASMDTLVAEFGPGTVADGVAPSEIEALVASYPNVIAWLVGHDHDVHVRPVAGADATHPGYWEIQSGSIADWPNQSRVIELVDNGDGTLSLFGTMIDYEARDCMERQYRRYALVDFAAAYDTDHRGTDRDRNVELLIPVPPSALGTVTALRATAPTRIESTTTLAGMP